MSAKKILTLIAAPFLALSLSACSLNSNKGAGTGGTGGVPVQTEESEDAGPALPTSPSDETSSYETDEPTQTQTYKTPDGDDFTTDDDDDYGGGYSAGKPSREEVKAGIEKVLERQGSTERLRNMGATDEQLDRAYQCITDEIYDKISDDDLKTIAQGDPSSPIDSASRSTLSNSAHSCGQKLGREIYRNRSAG